jgi:hypothetical protein
MTGQRYRGPVVLIVDALCYSTTDIFAAGFQDHWIGKIIGVDANTGAGGANVWDYERLRKASGGTGFEDLPDGTDMRIAIRRTLRVRGSDGIPVEEFGIDIKDEDRHKTTRADVLEGDVDLFAKAAYYLTHHSRPPYRLDVVAEATEGRGKRLTITTDRLTRLDAYLKGRPLCASIDLEPGHGVVTTVDFEGDETTALQIFGYDDRGGPVTEAAGPVAIFMPESAPTAPPAPAAPPPPRADEDTMADLPFDGYDTMKDEEVRARIAQELFKALDGYRAMITRARDTAKPSGHAEMIAEFNTELATLDDQIEEGTQRWGGLPEA